MDKDLADQVAGIAAQVVASGAISANGHGNVSVRVPGAEEMYFTAGPSLRGHPASAVVRVGLDGTLLEGELPPIQGAVVAMHTALYQDVADTRCVVHTHSPFATAFAVAQRPIDCWIEALAMFGLPDGVPAASSRGKARTPKSSFMVSWIFGRFHSQVHCMAVSPSMNGIGSGQSVEAPSSSEPLSSWSFANTVAARGSSKPTDLPSLT